MMVKQRLDVLLVEKGLFPSRERAKTSIMAGIIFVDDQKIDKPGTLVKQEATLEVKGNTMPFVSRGGLKLEKALSEFNINLRDKTVIDIGASTGGFTDCALQQGAKKVISVDVGYGQLAWPLRQDERVTNMERTNARYLTVEAIGQVVDFACTDVSFISLEKILPVMYQLTNENGDAVALIKPQFEAGRDKVGKKGVVRDPITHKEVIAKVLRVAQEIGFQLKGLSFSPITGPEGNIEYLLYLSKISNLASTVSDNIVSEVVNKAFQYLKK